MNFKQHYMKALMAVLLFASFEALSAEPAGNIIRSNGVVNATDASGKTRPLTAGDVVNVGDVVTSTEKSSVQIQMKDAAIIAMSANSTFKVDGYRFHEKGTSAPDKVDLTVQQGRIRTITGQAAKSGYSMVAPNDVVIKIKGTIYDILEMPDGSIIIILREGAVTVTSGGVTVVLDVPGTMTRIPAKGKPPSKPIPATESTDDLDAILPLTKTGPDNVIFCTDCIPPPPPPSP